MRPFFRPLHLLLLAESSAHYFVYRRLDKPRRDRLTVVIALPVIRDHVPVVHNRRPQLRQRLDQAREPGIGLAEGFNRALQVIDLAQRFVDLTMPERPFETLNLVAYLRTQHRLTVHQTLTELA